MESFKAEVIICKKTKVGNFDITINFIGVDSLSMDFDKFTILELIIITTHDGYKGLRINITHESGGEIKLGNEDCSFKKVNHIDKNIKLTKGLVVLLINDDVTKIFQPRQTGSGGVLGYNDEICV